MKHDQQQTGEWADRAQAAMSGLVGASVALLDEDLGDELAASGSGFGFMLVIVLVSSGGGEGEREAEQGGDEVLFHGLVSGVCLWFGFA